MSAQISQAAAPISGRRAEAATSEHVAAASLSGSRHIGVDVDDCGQAIAVARRQKR